ncbi:glucosyltransferase [Bacteroidia bacterium]|nr:glucosyltransferase [Bacteroidia bacterium]
MMNHPVEICYTITNSHAPFMVTSALSIVENTKEPVRFHVLTENLKETDQRIIIEFFASYPNVEFNFIQVSQELKKVEGLQLGWFQSYMPYARIFIPELLPDMGKCIYMDSDILVDCDIKELWSIGLESEDNDYALAAALDENVLKSPSFHPGRLNYLSDSHHYFNNGLLIINCKKWRDEQIAGKLIDLAKATTIRFYLPTQDLFNLYFANSDFLLIPMEYNSMPCANEHTKNYTAKIYHFCGLGVLPFNNKFEFFWSFFTKTPYYYPLYDRVIHWKTQCELSKRENGIERIYLKIKKICETVLKFF